MILIAASCPADVSVSIEISNACHEDSPHVIDIMPNVNETDK